MVLDADALALYVEPRRPVDAGASSRFRALVDRRAAHEPVQHILGFEEFRGLRIAVTPEVLIPRPETEALVERALELLVDRPGALVADMGTGSGAIACALAAARPDLEVLAVDQSLGALAVASDNVRALGLASRVRLLAGDLFGPLASLGGSLDMIVANPPYLPSGVIPTLPAEVERFEPLVALDGGPDGMRVLRRIIVLAPAFLRPGRVARDGDRRGAGGVAGLAHGRRGLLAHQCAPRPARRRALHRRTLGGRDRAGAADRARRPADGLLMPARLVIEGGVRLKGEVQVSAAKNAALPAMAASLLTAQPVILDNVPGLADVVTMRQLLERLGAETSSGPGGPARFQVARVASHEAPYDLVRTMRASVLVLGPLVARSGTRASRCPAAAPSAPARSTCTSRGWRSSAPRSALAHGYVDARARAGSRARGSPPTVTVTGTENLLMAAVLAKGETILRNAAREPEVADLARLLDRDGRADRGGGHRHPSDRGACAELGGARHRVHSRPDRGGHPTRWRRPSPAAT